MIKVPSGNGLSALPQTTGNAWGPSDTPCDSTRCGVELVLPEMGEYILTQRVAFISRHGLLAWCCLTSGDKGFLKNVFL